MPSPHNKNKIQAMVLYNIYIILYHLSIFIKFIQVMVLYNIFIILCHRLNITPIK